MNKIPQMIGKRHLKVLKEIVGESAYTTDREDLLIYTRDLSAAIPPVLTKAYGLQCPDIVLSVKNIEQVSRILSYAYRNDIPVTPRAAGSWALGGTIPMEGGIVLDMNSLCGILEWNEEDEYVRVEAGVEWMRLVELAGKRGFTVGANPSSGPSATVGGFISTGGGAGIGVSQYGSVGNQVLSMKVVLADGRIVETDPWSSWLFVGNEGTLGIICEVALKLFPKRERKYFMLGVDDLDQGVGILQALSELKPYYISFLDKGLTSFLNSAADTQFLEKEMTIVAVFEGYPEELEGIAQRVEEVSRGCMRYPESLARHEWESRYTTGLSFKKLGPSLFVQELRIPIRFLKEAIEELKVILSKEAWGIESLGSENGAITLVVQMLADERNQPEYLRKISYTLDMAPLSLRVGGAPFGIGLYNSPQLKKIHGKAGVEIMKKIRRHMDPKTVLNPSKTTMTRIPPVFVTLFMILMRYVPEALYFILETLSLLPASLLRFNLKLIGGELR